MKYCPKCHNEYVDTLNFCTQCGCPLETKPEGVAQPVAPSPRKPRKKVSVRRRLFILLLILVALLIGCYNYVSNLTTYIGLNPNRVVAPKAGGEVKVGIDYDGFLWSIDDSPEWVDIDSHADSFTVTFEKNTTGRNRSGIISVKSGKLLSRMVVVQQGRATYLSPSQSFIHFSKSGGVDTLRVSTDGGDWEPHCSINWTVKKIDEHTFSLLATENVGYAKTGYVCLEEDHQRAYIQVLQGGICTKCHGSGEISCKVCHGIRYPGHKCFFCNNTGTQPCDECQGRGEIE